MIKNPVFIGLNTSEYDDIIACGKAYEKSYAADEVIFSMGSVTKEFCLVLSGSVNIENIDLWGNRLILHNLGVQQIFAETYAFCGAAMMVNVRAAEPCRILFINAENLLSSKNKERSWYMQLLQNFLRLSAQKNLAWSNRMFCITSKGVRSRVMSYLSAEALKCGSSEITIPFSRQELADYLNIERSALSKELGRMQKEGLLNFKKNHFQLLNIK